MYHGKYNIYYQPNEIYNNVLASEFTVNGDGSDISLIGENGGFVYSGFDTQTSVIVNYDGMDNQEKIVATKWEWVNTETDEVTTITYGLTLTDVDAGDENKSFDIYPISYGSDLTANEYSLAKHYQKRELRYTAYISDYGYVTFTMNFDFGISE